MLNSCPKCGAPHSESPAQSPAVHLSDLPSRSEYIIAMLCLALSMVATIMIENGFGSEPISARKAYGLHILAYLFMLYPCIVIKKMLSYKRSRMGLWATRAIVAMYVGGVLMPIGLAAQLLSHDIFGVSMDMGSPYDLINMWPYIKIIAICMLIVYIVAFVAIGFAIVNFKGHARGGRWFMVTGVLLILATALWSIGNIYVVANFEGIMIDGIIPSDGLLSWLESIPEGVITLINLLKEIALLILFICGYMFLSKNDVQYQYAHVDDNLDTEDYFDIGWKCVIFVALVGGLGLISFENLIYWYLLFLVIGFVHACYTISYVELPSEAKSCAACGCEGESAAAPDAKPTVKSDDSRPATSVWGVVCAFVGILWGVACELWDSAALFILAVLLLIAHLTMPSDEKMIAKAEDEIMELVIYNTNQVSDKLFPGIEDIGSSLSSDDVYDSIKFHILNDNRFVVKDHWLWKTVEIVNDKYPDGKRIGFGLFGFKSVDISTSDLSYEGFTTVVNRLRRTLYRPADDN